MSELDLNALSEHVETVLGSEHHANLCNCREWPVECVNGLAAFTLSPEDVLRVAMPLIEAETRRKVAEEIRAKLDIDLRSTPWVEGYWFARDAAVAIARGGNEQTREET